MQASIVNNYPITAAIIPAVGGSKSLPRKNLLDFCGRPLLEWSIIQARAAKSVDEVFVTSDDPAILELAHHAGAIGIERPSHLASDSAPSEAALLHAIDWIEARDARAPERVVFLQATSPLREPSDIDGAVDLYESEGLDSLFSVALLEDFCIWRRTSDGLQSVTIDPNARGRRQNRDPLLLENGSIYVFDVQGFRMGRNRIGKRAGTFTMARWKACEIDEAEDVELCAYYFRRHGLHNIGAKASRSLRADSLDLVVFDFDGVMTDNRVRIDQNGVESVIVNRADGLGVDRLRSLGVPMLILSTERSPVVAARGAKLGVEVVQDCPDKADELKNLCRDCGYDLDRVLFVGNDVNDLSALELVGYPVAPSDAHPAVLNLACIVTRAPGGAGVVRELADLIEP